MTATGDLLARNRRFIAAEIELFGRSADGAGLLPLPGVVAAVNPATPDRSLFNWCIAESGDALLTALDELLRRYSEAGVRAWGVWLDGDDERTARELVARGHAADGRPVMMGAALSELTLPPLGDLRWSEVGELAAVATINDAAYGFPPPAFHAALRRLPDPSYRAYLAFEGERAVSSVVTWDSPDGDCGITAVATLPELGRRGLATRLLAAALGAARGRGAKTTTLQASTKGGPVYERLGYRNLGFMSLWEHRVQP